MGPNLKWIFILVSKSDNTTSFRRSSHFLLALMISRSECREKGKEEEGAKKRKIPKVLWLCSFINDSSPFVTAAESFDESLSFRKSSRLIILRRGTQLFCKASSCPLWIIAIIISMKWILAFQNGVGGGVPLRGNVYSSVVGLFCVPLWWKCTLADINLVYINVCRLLQVHLRSVSIVRRQINSHTRHQWSTFYREYKQYICVTPAVMGPYLLIFPMWSHVSGWVGHFASLSGGFNVTPMVMCLVLWQRGTFGGHRA